MLAFDLFDRPRRHYQHRYFSKLEKTFEVPVVEAYAMTEASHQMTCNQLPPGQRKPGTVGCAAGPEVAIMSESDSRLLASGETGEVVIRGDNVTTGYENNPTANAECFVETWFRTGDQGVMDSDGYLTITGRLKRNNQSWRRENIATRSGRCVDGP